MMRLPERQSHGWEKDEEGTSIESDSALHGSNGVAGSHAHERFVWLLFIRSEFW